MSIRIPILGSLILAVLFSGCRTEGMTRRLNSEQAGATIKDIRTAEEAFKSKQGEGRYGTLNELLSAGLMDKNLLSGIQNSYRFEIVTDGKSYSTVAVPLRINDQHLAYIGESFYMDESGIIRGTSYGRDNNYQPAGKGDQPIRYQ